MKRDMAPIDDIDNTGVMFGICVLALAFAGGIWCLVKLCTWVFS